MTNYERIKAMSVEEMAEMLFEIGNCCRENGYGYMTSCSRCPLHGTLDCEINGIKTWLERECDT